jgi:hypothetical protein
VRASVQNKLGPYHVLVTSEAIPPEAFAQNDHGGSTARIVGRSQTPAEYRQDAQSLEHA